MINIQPMRDYYLSQETKSYQFRIEALKKLKKIILLHNDEINEALKLDLNKSIFESYMTEIGMVISEINYMLHNLKKLMRRKKVKTPLAQFPSKSYKLYDPYGVVLIMSPWNYPFQLTISPLVGAIAGGNCAIVKPSNYSPNTSRIIKKIINEAFDSKYIEVILGGREENKDLLNTRFDLIFFTGSVFVGKEVMAQASKFLTPVILELGGKSPCIISNNTDIDLAAKRVVFGKILNAGQTCVAPDYCLVHSSVKEQFINCYIKYVKKFLSNPLNNDEYPKIINDKHYQRLIGLLDNVIYGGKYENGFIEPTLVEANFDSKIMDEEIFGPIMPIVSFDNFNEMIDHLKGLEHPLALYLFTNSKKEIDTTMGSISFGGGCINDTIVHLATSSMGFGGVGNSGMGKYHGKDSFYAFTHEKPILHKGHLDINLRYHPYSEKKLSVVKKMLK